MSEQSLNNNMARARKNKFYRRVVIFCLLISILGSYSNIIFMRLRDMCDAKAYQYALGNLESEHDVMTLAFTVCLDIHNRIIENTMSAPFQYRVLVPFTVEYGLSPLLGGGMSATFLVYMLLQMTIPILISLLIVFVSQRILQFDITVAFALMCGYLILHDAATYKNYNLVQAIDLVNVLFLLLAMILLYKSNTILNFIFYLILTSLAVFNRETGLLLIIFWGLIRIPMYQIQSKHTEQHSWIYQFKRFMYHWKQQIVSRAFGQFLVLLCVGFISLIFVQQYFGQRPPMISFDEITVYNWIDHLDWTIKMNVPVIFIAILAFIGFVMSSNENHPFRWLSIVSFIYIPFIMVFGLLVEVRLWEPLYVIFLYPVGYALQFAFMTRRMDDFTTE